LLKVIVAYNILASRHCGLYSTVFAMLFCNVFVFQLTVLLTLVRDYYYSVAVL